MESIDYMNMLLGFALFIASLLIYSKSNDLQFGCPLRLILSIISLILIVISIYILYNVCIKMVNDTTTELSQLLSSGSSHEISPVPTPPLTLEPTPIPHQITTNEYQIMLFNGFDLLDYFMFGISTITISCAAIKKVRKKQKAKKELATLTIKDTIMKG